jgi:hypothetical protein
VDPYVAEIVTVDVPVTRRCWTGKETVLLPLSSLTDAGTVANFVFELESLIVSPDVGAGPLKVTVPTTGVVEPPTTAIGESEKPASALGVIVSTVLAVFAPAVAVIVEVWLAVTTFVATAKVVDAALAGTTTEAGTETYVPVAVNATLIPPVGANPVNRTVPVGCVPLTAGFGLTLTVVKLAGVKVSVAVSVTGPDTAVSVTTVEVATPTV